MSDAPSAEAISRSTPKTTGEPRRRLAPQAPSHLVQALCQAAFAAELLDPGDEFWMAVRRLWNVPVLDNRANTFRHLEPNWPQAKVRLQSVLEKMMDEGTVVHVLTEDDPHNETFVSEFRGLQRGSSSGQVQTVDVWKDRQEGIVASSFYLQGGLQLSRRGGLSVAGRELRVYTDEESIAGGRRVFQGQWSGE
jgi:hypothetical protein